MPKEQQPLEIIQDLLTIAETNLKNAKIMIKSLNASGTVSKASFTMPDNLNISATDDGEQIIEWVFNGQIMKGGDGKDYPIPANYISKSKLVEWDTLKLTIKPDGKFVYKQIKPIERATKTGVLTEKEGHYYVVADGKSYRVILAAVTYYKIKPGDQVIINVPAKAEAERAAVDNILVTSSAFFKSFENIDSVSLPDNDKDQENDQDDSDEDPKSTKAKKSTKKDKEDDSFKDFDIDLESKEGELL